MSPRIEYWRHPGLDDIGREIWLAATVVYGDRFRSESDEVWEGGTADEVLCLARSEMTRRGFAGCPETEATRCANG